MGLTDHFIQGHVGVDGYEQHAEKLYQEVSRLNMHFKQAQNLHLQLSGGAPQEVDISTEREPIGCISSNTVANFFLLRSWNLLESMKYSECIIPKVRLTRSSSPRGPTRSG